MPFCRGDPEAEAAVQSGGNNQALFAFPAMPWVPYRGSEAPESARESIELLPALAREKFNTSTNSRHCPGIVHEGMPTTKNSDMLGGVMVHRTGALLQVITYAGAVYIHTVGCICG